MKAFTKITAIVAPLDRSNVDTDAIIPKQFLKSIKRSGRLRQYRTGAGISVSVAVLAFFRYLS